jgi:DNA replication protein DnaC
LVNRIEAETRTERPGRIADRLTRLDLVVLDELGYLPFAQSGGRAVQRSFLRRFGPGESEMPHADAIRPLMTA